MSGRGPQFLVAGCKALLRESKPQSFVRKYGTVSAFATQVTKPASTFDKALAASAPRNDWTKEEIKELYDTPLMNLAFAAVSNLYGGVLRALLNCNPGHRSQKVP